MSQTAAKTIGIIGLCVISASLATQAADPVSFRSDIAPILLENCVACHGAKNAEGGYRLDTFTEMTKPGDSGVAPLVGDGQPTGELLHRLTVSDQSLRMPAESEPLAEEQVALIADWLAAGAKFDGDNADELLPYVIPPPRHPDPPDSYPAAVPITAVAFSLDGSQVFTGGYHEILLWNAADGKLVRRIKNIGQRTFAIALSDDGATLAVACGEPGRSGEVRLVDFATGQVKGVAARSTDVVFDLAFRPGGGELAVASADKSIRIVNVETLQLTRTLASHADWVTAIAWSGDGSQLVSASRDKSAKVFDAESGQLLVSYSGHGEAVRGVSFLPDGKQVVSVGSDNKLHRWQIGGAKRVAQVALGGEGYRLIGGDGWVLVACTDHRLLQIDLGKNSVMREFKGHQDWVLSAAASSDQSRIVSGSHDGQVHLWNAADASLIHHWTAKP